MYCAEITRISIQQRTYGYGIGRGDDLLIADYIKENEGFRNTGPNTTGYVKKLFSLVKSIQGRDRP